MAIDVEGRLRWGNLAAERLFGWPLANWLGVSGIELVHPDDLEVTLLALSSIQSKEVGTPLEIRLRTATGWKLVELIGAPQGDDGDGSIILCLRDLTQRRRWEIASGDEASFRTLVHNSATLIMLVLPNGDVQSVSASLTRMLGHDQEVVEGRPLAELVHPDDQPLLANAFERSLSRGLDSKQPPLTVEVRLKQRARRATVPFELTIVNLVDDPTVGGFVVSGHDISRLRAAQEELESLARKDALTGLPNRASLDAYLTEALVRERPVAVAFIDLDRFKPVNDLFGHDAGDELLKQLASRLKAELRGRDFVARFGGDEFVVVADAGPADAAGLVERLESLVSEPFELASGPAQVFASVGVAYAAGGHTAESLLAEADADMYTVKRRRRGGPTEPSLAIATRRKLNEGLPDALAQSQFEVHYQPIWRLKPRELWGYEALVRWQHPERGLLEPAEFLGVIDDAGRDSDLGELVLRMACDFAKGLPDDSAFISVNVSAGQIASDVFPDLVAETIAASGLNASRLCLEVSERSILDRPAQGPATPILRNLERLASLGIRLAIDDYGTGYSSLSHVLDFPVTMLKIDESFVHGMAAERQSRSVVAALIELARGIGVDAVAEGIEEADQLEMLEGMGCPFGQGYLLGRPAAAPLAPA